MSEAEILKRNNEAAKELRAQVRRTSNFHELCFPLALLGVSFQGKNQEAATRLEKSLVVSKHLTGIESTDTQAVCKELAELYNVIAISCLQKGEQRYLAKLQSNHT